MATTYLKGLEICVVEHMPLESRFHSKLLSTVLALESLLMAVVGSFVTNQGFLVTKAFATSITDGVAFPPLPFMLLDMAVQKIEYQYSRREHLINSLTTNLI